MITTSAAMTTETAAMIVAAPALVTGDRRTPSRLARPPSAERVCRWPPSARNQVEARGDRPDPGRHAEQAGGGDHGELLEYPLVAAHPGADAERVGEGHRHQPDVGDEDAAPRDGEHRQQRAEHRQVRERVQQVEEERPGRSSGW